MLSTPPPRIGGARRPPSRTVDSASRIDPGVGTVTPVPWTPRPYNIRQRIALTASGLHRTVDPPMNVRPVTLEGRYVRLEPLGEQHVDALVEVGCGNGHPAPAPPSPPSATPTTGPSAAPRCLAIDGANRKLEIGGAWIAPEWQRRRATPRPSISNCDTPSRSSAACASSSRQTR